MRIGTWFSGAAAALILLSAVPASAQMTTIDPNTAIDSDLDTPPVRQEGPAPSDYGPYREQPPQPQPQPQSAPPVQEGATSSANARERATDTFEQDKLLSAAE